jgi:hypothetical protein
VIQVAPGTKVYLAYRPVSMRYGLDGLAAQAKQVLNGHPFSDHLCRATIKVRQYVQRRGLHPAGAHSGAEQRHLNRTRRGRGSCAVWAMIARQL